MSVFSDDVPVPSRSLADIDQVAEKVRLFCRLDRDALVDIRNVLRARRIELVVRSDVEMGKALALAASVPDGGRIFVRADVQRRLELVDPEIRYCIAHELGHLEMHRGAELKPLVVGGNRQLSFIREDESSERQAWKFARALMLHRGAKLWANTDSDIATAVALPIDAIRLRREEIKRLSQLGRPKRSIYHLTASASRDLSGGSSERFRPLWGKLQWADGYNPATHRLCKGYLIEWENYGVPNPPCHTGWFVREGEILPFLAIQS